MFNRSSAVLIVLCGLLLATAAHAEEGFLVSCDKSILGSKYIGTYKMAISGKLSQGDLTPSVPALLTLNQAIPNYS